MTSSSGSLRVDARRPPWRLALLAAVAAAVIGAAFVLQDGDAPFTTAHTAPLPSPQAVAAARGEAPFPALDLQLQDVTPQGAVIALASRPALYARGQEVFPGVVVHHIDRESVTLRFRDQERTLLRAVADAPTVAQTRDDAPAATPAPVEVAQLSTSRPLATRAFLDEVSVHAGPRGGFVVDRVLADGRYAQMGLQPGDVVYTLDTPAMRAVDETSMVALMLQTELELDVYRNGAPLRLRVALNADPPEPAPAVN